MEPGIIKPSWVITDNSYEGRKGASLVTVHKVIREATENIPINFLGLRSGTLEAASTFGKEVFVNLFQLLSGEQPTV
ncbi:hypothetical protein CHU98_g282 [Xylaria longipes]|nr:hypothetical protein CHU98_g282 [Xylaria longipes]